MISLPFLYCQENADAELLVQPTHFCPSVNEVCNICLQRVLTIYTDNPEILVGSSNGTYHSMSNVSEIMGQRLNQSLFLFF